MKKILICLLISSQIFSKNFDDRLKEVELQRKTENLGSFSKLSISSGLTRSGDFKDKKNTSNNFMLSTNYGWFDHNITVNLDNNKVVAHSIGAKKTLNDFFFDKKKEVDNNYFLRKHRVHKEEREKRIQEYGLVGQYKIKEFEISLFNDELANLNKEEIILDKQYELGKISKNDYDFAKRNMQITRARIDVLENDLQVLRMKLEEKNIDINKYNFEYFDRLEKSEIENYVKNNDIHEKMLEIEKAELTYAKAKVYGKYPKTSLGLSYDILHKGYVASLNFNHEFALYDESVAQIRDNYEKEMKNKGKINVVKNRMELEQKSNYDNLRLNLLDGLSALDRAEREEKIFQKKYELGSESLVKLMDKRNELIKAKLNVEKAKLELSSLIYTIKRGVK